jgi:hypothetical protein
LICEWRITTQYLPKCPRFYLCFSLLSAPSLYIICAIILVCGEVIPGYVVLCSHSSQDYNGSQSSLNSPFSPRNLTLFPQDFHICLSEEYSCILSTSTSVSATIFLQGKEPIDLAIFSQQAPNSLTCHPKEMCGGEGNNKTR